MSATYPAAAVRAPASPGFPRAFWVTLRPYLFFVSGSAGLVGLAIAPTLDAAAFALAFAAFFFSYGLGQALTDVFQTDTDSLSAPYRPLVRGEVGRTAVLATSLAGLLLCTVALARSNPWNLALALAAVAGLLAYSPLKRRWWGGPPCNAAVVALLPAMGLLCGGLPPGRAIRSPLLLPAAASAFCTYAVFVLLGYLKDVAADRATGYETFAVRFGRRATVAASAGFAVFGTAASLVLLVRGLPRFSAALWAASALWLAGAGLFVAAHVRALRVRADSEAHPAIVLSVWAFVCLHLGEAALLRPRFLLLALPLLVVFERALEARPCREQV